MCKDCGCGQAGVDHDHDHAHGHSHEHHHDHSHSHDHDHTHAEHESVKSVTKTLTLEQNLLERNNEAAAANRAWLAERGIVALNLISAPGTGKTALLEKTLESLASRIGSAVITGDQQTDLDAKRLQDKGAPVFQIETQSACHLDAARVGEAMRTIVAPETRLLFIENVGNLVCPAAFDLGETFKVALMSVTEGEDKPLKYPSLFTQAPVVVLTKIDLVPHLDWDMPRCRTNLRRVHPGVFMFELSARTGVGMDAWADYLESLTT